MGRTRTTLQILRRGRRSAGEILPFAVAFALTNLLASAAVFPDRPFWIRPPRPARVDAPLVEATMGWIRSNAPTRNRGTNVAWILGGDLAVSESELADYVRSSLAPALTNRGLAQVRLLKPAGSREFANARALLGSDAFDFRELVFSSGLSDADGSPIRWQEGKSELVFCVARSTFSESQYSIVTAGMAAAAADWNRVSTSIRFRYDPSLDPEPRRDQFGQPIGHDFSVASGTPPFQLENALAQAFLPSAPPHARRIEVFPHYFDQTEYDPVGVFRHELGHVLGLVHEHNRTEGCPVDVFEAAARFRPLTPQADTNSVMHYLCASVGNRQWSITEQDALGLKVLYSSKPSFLDYLPGTR